MMKQLSFKDLDDDKRSWNELSDQGKWFLGPHGTKPGIHPGAPPPKRPESPYLKLLRAWKQDQKKRFAPAKKLGG